MSPNHTTLPDNPVAKTGQSLVGSRLGQLVQLGQVYCLTSMVYGNLIEIDFLT